jgi:diaminopimelate decarboxylase
VLPAPTSTRTDPSPATAPADTEWWVRPGLEAPDERLVIAGEDAEALARRHGTPLFVYDLDRIRTNARAIEAALARTGLPHVVRFALKANREPEVLAVLRGLGKVGIDACSPGEAQLALASGWTAEEISYTGTNLSERDLDLILGAPIHLNLDAVSQVERVGRRAPGRTIGLRVNPGAGAGYNDRLEYAGDRPTKFGVWPDRLDEAVAVARRYRLTIDTVHFHAGSGWLTEGLPRFEGALARAVGMVERLRELGCPIHEVNVGGGLGTPARADEQAVDLDDYAAVLARHLGPLHVTIAVEPGDRIARDAGLLLSEVVTVERRGEVTFVGLDLGWNVNCSYMVYGFAQELIACRAANAPRTQIVTVAGHINEAGDLFAEDYPMPPVEEGDIVALVNAGSYLQAMSSTHCLRPTAPAIFLGR